MTKGSYILTSTARRHLREAKVWSLARWGEELTAHYFNDMDKAARYLAENWQVSSSRNDLIEKKVFAFILCVNIISSMSL